MNDFPTDEDRVQGRIHGEQPQVETESVLVRILYSILLAMMMGVAQSILSLLTVIQIIIMIFKKGAPNENLADFATDLGVWMAKAVRYMGVASDVKPWPWTDLD